MIKIVKSILWSTTKYTSIPNKYYLKRNKWRLPPWKDKDFMFIHIPKNAGVSISSALNLTDPGHFTYNELSKLGLLDNKKIIFSVLRDPISRIISTYNFISAVQPTAADGPLHWIAKYHSLNDFILKGLTSVDINSIYFIMPQYRYVDTVNDTRLRYLRFETLNNDFNELSNEFSLNARLPNKNTSIKKDIVISNDALKVIYELYEKDFELINKVF